MSIGLKHPLPFTELFQNNKNGLLKLGPDELGRLRRELMGMLGPKRGAGLILRWGYSCGQADAMTISVMIKNREEFPNPCSKVPDQDEFHFSNDDSPEAQAVLSMEPDHADQHQFHFIAGYLTGFISAQTGEPVVFFETHCRANGHNNCAFVGKKMAQLTDEEKTHLVNFEEDNMASELDETVDLLNQTRNRYQNLFEQSSVPIFIIDPDSGAFLNMNMAASDLTGYSKLELLKMNVFDICVPTFHSQIAELVKTLVAEGRAPDCELAMARKDQTIRHIIQSSKFMTYGDRQVIQAALRDITDLKYSEQKEKALQDQLMKSERLSSIGRLAANVAHELKNPLGAIRNALYYIKTSLANTPALEADPHLKDILKLAEGEVDTSVMIIGELLDFSRTVNLVPRKTQINELVSQLPKIITTPDNVKIHLDLDQNLPIAMVDPDRLKQVLVNLANNGIQSMPHGGTLMIQTSIEVDVSGTTDKKDRQLHIAFEDTGVGIEPENLSKIFEPLFTTKAQGTGLGLAICNNIIEKHGGKITVVSQKGKGSRFTVKIPLQIS